ncbi:hypothetical protein DFH28DRAFT_952694 [Melampsora americana]|nr:hypothetical protein DFH28DRAFT_952694 [Melampsora americana]
MSASNILTQSTASQPSVVAVVIESPHDFIGPGFVHPVSFMESNSGSVTARTSGITALSEKLEEMEIQKSSHLSRLSTRQKRPSVTPYYRKPKFVRDRTPEAPRRHKRQKNSDMTAEIKDPKKEVGKAT